MSKSTKDAPSLKIGTNDKAKNEFKLKMSERVLAFTEIVKLAQKHDLEFNKEALYANPKHELYRAIKETLGSEGVLAKVSVEKLCDLFEIDLTLVTKAIQVFSKDESLVFNPFDYSYKLPSFDIVLKGESKVQEYKELEAVIKAMSKFEDVIPVYVQRAFGGRIYLDTADNKLKPNVAMLIAKK